MNYTRRGLSRFRNLPDLFAFSEKMRPSGLLLQKSLRIWDCPRKCKILDFLEVSTVKPKPTEKSAANLRAKKTPPPDQPFL